MEFDLEDFQAQPTVAKLNKCKKDDLRLVADAYGIQVPLSAKKIEIRELIYVKLSEEGLMGDPVPIVGVEAPAAGAGVGEVVDSPAPLRDPPVQPKPMAEELELNLRIREAEVRQRELEVQAMHLKVRALELEQGAAASAKPACLPTPSPSPHAQDGFDVSRHVALAPPFRESEVDSYFSAFERIAATLNWPKNVWPLLLQCKLVGKAQEVCNSLSIEDSLNYDVVKTTVL